MTSAKVLLRRQNILSMIREFGEVSVEDASKAFEISQATFRRDIKTLEENEEVWRLGRNIFTANPHLIRGKTSAYNKEHMQIAKAVVESLDNNTIILLGPDPINVSVSNVLLTTKHGLTILVSNIKHATILRNQNMHEVYLLGGSIEPRTGVLTGPFAERIITEIISDVAIFGCESINPNKGILFQTATEAQFMQKVIKYCRRLFILADHSQFSSESCGALFPFDKVNTIFTDTINESEVVQKIRDIGVKVVQTELS